MAGKHRALLIGNSTYPADEHNLQPLKGPVKDIAALNRALTDPETGLFDDVDVSLLAEVTSTRALRAMSRFYADADRDDVLMLYFSGHGKLDQSGRLHLCMQDTESTDLLSTAVSSTRINEFAEASRARNVVIVLDCCYAGAFRGGDFGDSVSGPGRYVLTSCRSTQLANDATVDNQTSHFTQHLVDGLLGAAVDRDHDGYVDFSDVYAYVDAQLRVDGRQIPQRRVAGDGDLRLARRPVRARAEAVNPPPACATTEPIATESAAVQSSAGEPAIALPTAAEPAPPSVAQPSRRRFPLRGRRLVAGLIAVVLVIVGTTIWIVTHGVTSRRLSTNPTIAVGTFTATAPWRIRVMDQANINHDPGCFVAIADRASGEVTRLAPGVDARVTTIQIHEIGTFELRVNHADCLVVAVAGVGSLRLPLTLLPTPGDSDAFATSPRLSIRVIDFQGNGRCLIKLTDPASGQLLGFSTATVAEPTVLLTAGTARTAYVNTDNCGVNITGA